MASTPVSPGRYRPRREPGTGRLARLVIALTGLVAVLAIGPIAWGIAAGDGAARGPGSAFAVAPPGTYVLVTRTEGSVDVIAAVRADQPANPFEIARVPHLDGFRATGAVDPAGRFAALVAVDGGSPVQPRASLIVVDLQRGGAERLVTGIEPLQTPLWTRTGDGVIVTRAGSAPGGGPVIEVLEVRLDGAVRIRWAQSALAVAPVGWRGGQLLTVALDERGSTLQAEGQDLLRLSTSITRDWALSPDGSAIAFVEVSTESGVRYIPRVAALDAGAAVSAQALSVPGVEALGVAWRPGGAPAFGAVPRGDSSSGDASAHALRADAGFDVPLAYSPDGAILAVTHWSGSSFSAPGRPELQLVGAGGRAPVPGFEGFLGWVRR